jgi:hypothetical protein
LDASTRSAHPLRPAGFILANSSGVGMASAAAAGADPPLLPLLFPIDKKKKENKEKEKKKVPVVVLFFIDPKIPIPPRLSVARLYLSLPDLQIPSEL